MPLRPPNLDDRHFEELFEEARSRIPRYLPEWTDWNHSDPGITLLQLQAWLADTILYRVNQIPELNYIKFLQLLGVEQEAAKPARADLTFTLKESFDRPDLLIPERVIVGVSDPDLQEPLYFETDRSFRAISARMSLLIRTVSGTNGIAENVTEVNNTSEQSFAPFGEEPPHSLRLIIGFSSPLPFPRGEIGLQFYLQEGGQALLSQPDVTSGGDDDPHSPALSWEWWNGVEWENVVVTGDDTRSLTQSGQVFFRVPGQIPAVPYSWLGLPAFEEEEEDEGADQPNFYWISVHAVAGTYSRPPRIDRILTNTVTATAAQTVFDEAVGSSSGDPNQVMQLRHTPVLADPPLQLEVDEGHGPRPWEPVADFLGSGAHDEHYLLNRTTGEISFGDGRRGRIPLAGQFNVIAPLYRYGGGRIGNVGAGTITDLATPLPGVESVTNFRGASGGDDEEPLEDTKVRGPRQLLKSRNRAVTLEDFAELARATPGAQVARSHAIVGSDQNGGATTITVVIVPQSSDPRPVPTEAARRMVSKYLDRRRLVTTRLKVRGPIYHDIDVMMDIGAHPDSNLREIKGALIERMEDYFHPLRGGSDSAGWPFGRDAYYSEVLKEVMLTPGVQRVERLALRKLLARFDDEPPSSTDVDAAIADERKTFPGACSPDGPVGAVVTVVEEDPENGYRRIYYVAAEYDCCDLPVAEGALIALRFPDISVSHTRSGSVS
jgi:predicted phage baseplate assembly protein